MESKSHVFSALCVVAVTLTLSCRDDADSTKAPNINPSKIDRPAGNERLPQVRPGDARPVVPSDGRPRDKAASEGRNSSADWLTAVTQAASRYSGDDFHAFLEGYIETHRKSGEFDRVGLIGEVAKHMGPGSRFLAVVTGIYSGPLAAEPSQVISEIEGLGLSPFERAVVLSAAVTGPVMSTASVASLSKALGAAADETTHEYVNALIEARVTSELGKKSPAEVVSALGADFLPGDLNHGNIVDRLVQEAPEAWEREFRDYCEGKNPVTSELIRNYGPRMVEGLVKQMGYGAVLEAAAKAPDADFQTAVAAGVGSRWAATDAGEVAKWADKAPAGPLRDAVVFELCGRLYFLGLANDADGWAKTVASEELRAKLAERKKQSQ